MSRLIHQNRVLTRGRPNNAGTRTANGISIRSVEENERKFTISFSSEKPVVRYWGLEILDHAENAVDLERIKEVGCLLFNHNRDRVVGKITNAWVEDRRCYAEVEFDDDDESEKIRAKVASGTLTGVSVAYEVDSWEEVASGKVSADGRFTGPCEIARKWSPLEISIVSIPADPTVGVGREMENIDNSKPSIVPEMKERSMIEVYERQLQINMNNYMRLGGKMNG